VQVRLIALLEPGYLVGRDSIVEVNERLIQKRLNTVPLSDAEKKIPADGSTQRLTETSLFFLARNVGTSGY